MATLPTGIRAFWLLAHGDIPAGWSRDADKDTYYFSGAIDAGGSGGNVSHDHPFNDHGLTGVAHKHAVSAASVTVNSTFVTGVLALRLYSGPTHGHVSADSSEQTITYGAATGLSTDATSDHDPPWIEAIIIQPDDANQQLPDDAVGLWDDEDTPVGYQFANGGNGSPNMTNRFIRGAPNLANGGDTGGTDEHTHTDAAGHSNHAISDHPHDTSMPTGLSDNAFEAPEDPTGAALAARDDHHDFILTDESLDDLSNETMAVSAASNLPAYVRLAAMQNQSGGEDLTPGIILMFDDAIGTLPPDWLLCDGTKGTQNTIDKQIYVASVPGEIGDTGGADSNAHGTAPHTHTHTAPHDHPIEIENLFGENNHASGSTVMSVRGQTPHVWTVVGTTPTVQSANPSTGSVDFRKLFKGMRFVKHNPPTVWIKGGKILGGVIAA